MECQTFPKVFSRQTANQMSVITLNIPYCSNTNNSSFSINVENSVKPGKFHGLVDFGVSLDGAP